jgi:hypothetical protein
MKMGKTSKLRIIYNNDTLHEFDNCNFHIIRKEGMTLIKIEDTMPLKDEDSDSYQGA